MGDLLELALLSIFATMTVSGTTAGLAWFGWRSLNKRPLCLVCSFPLSTLGKSKVISCFRCRITYHRTTVLEADPEAWESIRKNRLFSVSRRRDTGVQIIQLDAPLSALKGAGEDSL